MLILARNYRTLCDTFLWELPEYYNIGVDICDKWTDLTECNLVVGYPPCPHIDTFKAFLEKRYDVQVVVGTHSIPKKYLDMHTHLGTWTDAAWQHRIAPTMADEAIRALYD